MPANLSPEYKKAEQAFRAARDEAERLGCLRDMLRTIPKHKGTEHLQRDIKSRIKQLTEELAGPRKGAARSGPVHTVRREGAAQIALLGPPNAGKSSLHVKLTGSRADVGPYPHTTHAPMPGMLAYEDIHFQLIDLPPISADFFEPWFVNALQPADAALLIVDISDPECTDHVESILARLEERKITLTPRWPAGGPAPRDAGNTGNRGNTGKTGGAGDAGIAGAAGSDRNAGSAGNTGNAGSAKSTGNARQPGNGGNVQDIDDDSALDPFRIVLPTLLVANKIDRNPDPEDIRVLKELTGVSFPARGVSVESGLGLDALGSFLFTQLEVVRVYTKAIGKPAEMDRPFTLRAGASVLDVARLVHKDIAGSLRYARAWGTDVFDGQQVGPEHPVSDGDIVELHMR